MGLLILLVALIALALFFGAFRVRSWIATLVMCSVVIGLSTFVIGMARDALGRPLLGVLFWGAVVAVGVLAHFDKKPGRLPRR